MGTLKVSQPHRDTMGTLRMSQPQRDTLGTQRDTVGTLKVSWTHGTC